MALLTIEDIQTYLGRNLSTQEEDRLEMLLDLAIGEIEGYLGRPVGPTEFVEEVEIDEGGKIFLSNTPVISVDSISINGEEINTDFWKPTKWGIQYLDSSPSLYDPVFVGSGWYGEIAIVEYTAGIDNRAINSLLLFGVVNKLNEFPVPVDVGCSTTAEVDVIPDPSTAGQAVKRIKVEDFEVEYESATKAKVSAYASQSSSMLIFPSVLDFISIKRFKRLRTA